MNEFKDLRPFPDMTVMLGITWMTDEQYQGEKGPTDYHQLESGL